MTDFNYTESDFFTMLMPNNDEAVVVYNEIAGHFDGVARFPSYMKPDIFKQIKDAGYTIRKARKISDKEMDNILAELEA